MRWRLVGVAAAALLLALLAVVSAVWVPFDSGASVAPGPPVGIDTAIVVSRSASYRPPSVTLPDEPGRPVPTVDEDYCRRIYAQFRNSHGAPDRRIRFRECDQQIANYLRRKVDAAGRR